MMKSNDPFVDGIPAMLQVEAIVVLNCIGLFMLIGALIRVFL